MVTDKSSSSTTSKHALEVQRGERFEFGRNWRQFLSTLDEQRIAVAEQSLQQLLNLKTLEGQQFLDIGSGSGLFSLAARRMGAAVHSFDYDPQSVACTAELKRRYFPDDNQWTVAEASVLDAQYMASLGQFDIVYSWGVLHQTGDMWQALEYVARAVRKNGRLFISIYNDQGGRSQRWKVVKRVYNRSPRPIKLLLVLGVGAYWEARAALIRLVRFQNPLPFADWAKKKQTRGMSVWHDLVDWVGGYPFEVAKPEDIFNFFRDRGFTLLQLTTEGCGHGCNQYVFLHVPVGQSPSGDADRDQGA